MLYGLPADDPAASVPLIVADAGLPLLAVNVRLAGFPACVIVITSPASASVAVAVMLTVSPSLRGRLAGTVMTGARFTVFTVNTVVPLALRTGDPQAVAAPTLSYRLPTEAATVSVPVIVADAGLPLVGVNVRLAGFPACVIAIVSPASASVAVAVRFTAVPSFCVRFAGTVGSAARMTLFTVKIVVAVALRTGDPLSCA